MLTALLSAAYVYVYIVGMSQASQVVVAAQEIEPGSRIEANMVQEANVAQAAIHERAARLAKEVVGLYARQVIHQGEQVLLQDVSGPDQSGISSALREGLGAMFMPSSLVRGLDGLLAAGDLVDIVFVGELTNSGNGNRVALTVERSLPVVRVTSNRDTDGGGGILLAVSSDQARRLALCMESGSVYLVPAAYGQLPEYSPAVYLEELYTPVEYRSQLDPKAANGMNASESGPRTGPDDWSDSAPVTDASAFP